MIDWSGRYGSRSGLLRLLAARVVMSVGGYRALQTVDFARVSRLVFVCKGNICRSAYAEAWARHRSLQAVSCGIEAIEGAPANERVQRSAGMRGIAMHAHLSQPLGTQVFSTTDLLVGMEAVHVDTLLLCHGGAQVTLLGLWSRPRRPYLHDPYSAPDLYMEKCLDIIQSAVDELASCMRNSR